MRIDIPFTNIRTGEIRTVKVGWSWTLFLFGLALGIPFFVRKLNWWGAGFAAIWFINLLLNALTHSPMSVAILNVCALSLCIWVGLKGNEITAKHYLANGWRFMQPDSEMVKYAQHKWGMLAPYHDFGAPPATERKYPTFD